MGYWNIPFNTMFHVVLLITEVDTFIGKTAKKQMVSQTEINRKTSFWKVQYHMESYQIEYKQYLNMIWQHDAIW